MSEIEIVCAHCGKKAFRYIGHVNRSNKLGNQLYCGRTCAGLGRRKNKSLEQKKEEKRLYDIEYRAKNFERDRPKRAAYFQLDYARRPEHYKKVRQRRMAAHVEYCRRPEYRAKKHIYDRARYAKGKFGDWWENHVLVMQIGEECERHMSKYEIRLKNGTLNKTLRRIRNGQTKRSYA